jgi:hypothetical protein
VAIKGKSRKRSKPRGTALPPRPAVGARKTALPLRKEVKRAAVIVLAVLAFLGGLRVWQNVSRADALEKFNERMATAQGALIKHFAPEAPAAFDKNVTAFTQGTIGGTPMIALAGLWEKDFRASQTAVEKLKAPNKVAEDAKFLIEQGISGYIGVVRLFNLAGQIRQLSDVEKDAKQKQLLKDKVQVILVQADELRKQRADVLYTRGAKLLSDLNIQYGIEQAPSQTDTSQTGTQQ